ncbi:MAG: hypothetical protein AVDCRST_MAG32-2959, partial [uncultured Nocardioides sp.]
DDHHLPDRIPHPHQLLRPHHRPRRLPRVLPRRPRHERRQGRPQRRLPLGDAHHADPARAGDLPRAARPGRRVDERRGRRRHDRPDGQGPPERADLPGRRRRRPVRARPGRGRRGHPGAGRPVLRRPRLRLPRPDGQHDPLQLAASRHRPGL